MRSPLVYVLQHQQNPKDVQITHISLLKPPRGGDTIDSINEMLKYTYPDVSNVSDTQDEQVQEQKEIEAILAHRPVKGNKHEFRVRYRGFTARYNKWVHEDDMRASTFLDRYWQAVQLRKDTRPTKKRGKGKGQ